MQKKWLLSLLLFFSFAVLEARTKAGKVVTVEGTVYARSDEKGSRKLSRGSTFFSGETIEVGGGSRTQLRFTDGSLINLTPNTEYQIEDYSYNDKRESDRSSSKLVKGGFRQLTGTIAKNNPDNFKVKTPVATIGVRGTLLQVLLRGDELIVGCFEGQILLYNNQGSVSLGPEEVSQFSVVSSMDQPPTDLPSEPSAFETANFEPPADSFPTNPDDQAGRVFIEGGC